MHDLKGKVSELLEMPREVVLNLPRVEIVGNLQVSVENHQGILEYVSRRLRLNTTLGELVISGSNLVIRRIMRDSIHVEGNILRVEFMDAKGQSGTDAALPEGGGPQGAP